MVHDRQAVLALPLFSCEITLKVCVSCYTRVEVSFFYYTHFHHITELVTCYKEYKGTKPCVSFLGDFLILIGS